MDNKQILEALQMQPLSEDEKKARHILGRLYGPIATCKESTRNGRLYNDDLWNNQLEDEIFKEKIANKSLFLELGHPLDREETDMEKVCACIPEMPKMIDGDLYAYVDILDTKNGRLLKTLCDYGFVPGISSRGSGDIMDNNEVDPETFFLETWDIVQLPAVKKARMQVCESIDHNQMKLRKALAESYKNSSDEDKKIMKETLDNLDIDFEEPEVNIGECLKESLTGEDFDKVMQLASDCGMNTIAELGEFMKEHNLPSNADGLVDALQKHYDELKAKNESLTEADGFLPGGTPKNVADIPFGADDINSIEDNALDLLVEDKKLTEADEDETEEEPVEEESDEEIDIENIEVNPEEETEEVEEVEETEETSDEDSKEDEEEIVEDEEENPDSVLTVRNLKDLLDSFDDELPVEINSTVIDGVEYETELSIDDEAKDKVIIGVNCIPAEEGNEDIEEVEEDEDDSKDEEAEDKAEDESEEAVDDGEEEVIESLKEAIRQKAALEKEVKTLKGKQTVGDAKVSELKEELEKYKTAFARVSELAAKSTTLEKDIKALKEELTQKENSIKQLEKQAATATTLTESVNSNEAKIKSLTEKLNSFAKEAEANETALKEELSETKKKLAERTTMAKTYKAKANKVLEKYIESKASMLGVRPTEITRRLSESYTMDDIDHVCDDLLTYNVNMSKLPFGIDRSKSIKVTESVSPKKVNYTDPDNGYELDDSLFELAGLTKNQF